MAKKYSIRYSGHSVEMSKPSSTVLVYKIPYLNLKVKNYGFEIPNNFIVYILYGKNDAGRDVVYVGKSKNGLTTRPTSHKDKYDDWSMCYVLTQFKERTFFNDGTIQYLEDKLNKRINDLNSYQNTTEMTATGTANKSDEEDCDDYLEEAYDMLFVLGLDLFTSGGKKDELPLLVTDVHEEKKDAEKGGVPDGEYIMFRRPAWNHKKQVNARLRIVDGKYIVLKGSDVSPVEGKGLSDSIRALRESEEYVENGKLLKDLTFTSPSSAAMFVLGASSNGWNDWRTEEAGTPLDTFRYIGPK